MLDAIGPGAYALRADTPDLTVDGDDKIVPMRAAPSFFVANGDPDPRGMTGDRRRPRRRRYDPRRLDRQVRDHDPLLRGRNRGRQARPAAGQLLARRPQSQRSAGRARSSPTSSPMCRASRARTRSPCSKRTRSAPITAAARSTPRPDVRSRCYERIRNRAGQRLAGTVAGRRTDVVARAAVVARPRHPCVPCPKDRGLFRPDSDRGASASGWIDGSSLASAAAFVLWFLPVAVAAVAIPTLLAWLYARTTVFTITNRRVVMRYGVALPWSLNLPYRTIQTAAMNVQNDGTADIAISLLGPRPHLISASVAVCAAVADQQCAADAARVCRMAGTSLTSSRARCRPSPRPPPIEPWQCRSPSRFRPTAVATPATAAAA